MVTHRGHQRLLATAHADPAIQQTTKAHDRRVKTNAVQFATKSPPFCLPRSEDNPWVIASRLLCSHLTNL